MDDIIDRHSMLIRYLPPFTREYSPVELSFNVLKSWIKKHFVYLKDASKDILRLSYSMR